MASCNSLTPRVFFPRASSRSGSISLPAHECMVNPSEAILQLAGSWGINKDLINVFLWLDSSRRSFFFFMSLRNKPQLYTVLSHFQMSPLLAFPPLLYHSPGSLPFASWVHLPNKQPTQLSWPSLWMGVNKPSWTYDSVESSDDSSSSTIRLHPHEKIQVRTAHLIPVNPHNYER